MQSMTVKEYIERKHWDGIEVHCGGGTKVVLNDVGAGYTTVRINPGYIWTPDNLRALAKVLGRRASDMEEDHD